MNITDTLRLRGANYGVAGNASRGPESIIDGGLTDASLVIADDNVIVDGFKIIRGSNGLNAGVYVGIGASSGYQVLNNVITDNAIGVYANCDSSCLIKHNLFDGNNQPGPAGGSGIYAEGTNTLTIEENEFKNHTENNPVIFGSTVTGAHTGLVFKTNSIHDSVSGVYLVSVHGGNFEANNISTDGSSLIFGGDDTNITVTKNNLHNGFRAVRVGDDGYSLGANSNITVNRNAITGNTDTGVLVAAYTGNLNATCNWWGSSTGPSTVGTGSGDGVSAGVTFSPWLVSSILTSGCTGTPQEITVSDLAGHDFGSQNVAAGATIPFTFTVTNDGAINLVLGTVTIVGSSASHFALDTDNCSGVTLAPAASCTIDVVFDPSTTGPKSATLRIPSNDTDEPLSDRALTGNGTTGPSTGTIKIVLDAAPNSSQNFGFTGDTGSFALDDDNNNTLPSSRTVTLAPGTYDVTQGTVAGWSLTGLSCTTGEVTDIPTRTATITLTAGENVVCTFTDTHRLADALVSKKANKKYAGDNIYSSSVLASQTRNLAVARNTTKKLFFRFQNASLATDSFTIDANLSGSTSFSVLFFNGATDITAAVMAGTYSINNLASGAQVTIEARITAASNTAASATRNIDVFQTSTSEPSVMDVVRGHITRL